MSKKNKIEVEIKSLLGEVTAMESLISRMRKIDKKLTLKGKNKQLNHYFTEGNLKKLESKLQSLLSPEQNELLKEIITYGKNHSVRTRKADDNVLFIIKASVDETTSSNGTARSEFEVLLPEVDITTLDSIILNAGFDYQAKWSRERQEYLYKNYSVAVDKNAGYGYLAEFERVVPHGTDVEAIKNEVRAELSLLELEELDQERLARMFDHYNKNWEKYYGTENTFVIL